MLENCIETWDGNAGDLRGVLMVGVCLENVVGSGCGPELKYVSPGMLRSVKLTHPEVSSRLRTIRNLGVSQDCWIWNTCNRFEVYVFYQDDPSPILRYLVETFFGSISAPEESLNVLWEEEATHHLLRTLVGLNSGLPGESDVEKQLESAISASEHIGVLTKDGQHFVESLVEAGNRKRSATEWRRFTPSYCEAALDGVFAKVGREAVADGPIAIVGSSTTSRTCVEILENHFGIAPNNITVYHRCHGKDGQMKMIRRVSNGCNRVRVEDYTSPEVLMAVSKSSMTIFGIDRHEPILTAREVESFGMGNGSNLVCVDFNTFGSTQGIADMEGIAFFGAEDLEEEVREYARRMVGDPRVCDAIGEIEPLLRTEAYDLHRFHFEGDVSENEFAGCECDARAEGA
jgi:glutamyl-tRNA reductase